MKKVLMVLLSLVLVFSIVGIVSAAEEIHVGTDDSDKSEATMTVKLGVEQMYVITLPTEVVLDSTGETVPGGSVDITDLVLLNSESLNIYVESENDWKVKYTDQQTGDHFISYRMERTGWGTAFTQALPEGPALFATVPMNTYNHENPPSFGLTFTKTGPISTFGEYVDTLTFTVSTSNTVSQQSS